MFGMAKEHYIEAFFILEDSAKTVRLETVSSGRPNISSGYSEQITNKETSPDTTNIGKVVIICLNVQCITNKLVVLSLFVDEARPSVLCISEHWLNADEGLFYGKLRSLNMISVFCRQKHKNGGTAIFVHESINSRAIDLGLYSIEKQIELAAVELVGLADKLTIVSVYRPPNGDLDTFIHQLDICLDSFKITNKSIIVCGDFNIHLETISSEETKFTNLLRAHGMFITTRQPTRGDACLDTMATNLNSWDYNVRVEDPMVADHTAVILEVKTYHGSVSITNSPSWYHDYTFFKRQISDDNIPLFKHALKSVKWSEVLTGSQPTVFDSLFKCFISKFNEFFPLVRTKPPMCKLTTRPMQNKAGKSWYNAELARLKLHVQMLHDLIKLVNGADKSTLQSKYSFYKKLYRDSISEAKKAYNVFYIESAPNKCKAAWEVVNSNRSSNSKSKPMASPNDFNDFFVQSVEDIVSNIPPCRPETLDFFSTARPPNFFSVWREVRQDRIIKIVKGFKPSKSQDVYGVSCSMLKCVIESIADPLCVAINSCLRSGVFPDCLKIARTIPIFKKGDHKLLENYRPISIIPALAKLLETIMKEQLYSYFENNNLFLDRQHGFRRGRSTASAVLSLVEKITGAFEDRESVSITLCDLSKAFDCVSHRLLLRKIAHYGISDKVHSMLASYLVNRKQMVVLDGARSTLKSLNHGVPQGSVLGPLLFLILVNDLVLDGRTLLFADDTTLVTRGKDVRAIEVEAAEVLKLARRWFQENKLQMNEGKTQKLLCTLKQGIQNNEQEPVKLLGFWLDAKLTWTPHIASVCSKLSRVIYLLKKLRRQVTEPYLISTYHALFHSHLNYGLVLWGHSGMCEDVLKLQKKALRVMTFSGYREHCRPLFARLGILTVYAQYVINSICLIRETVIKYPSRCDTHSHNTRHAKDIDVPRTRLIKSSDSFPLVAVKLYNKLPQKIRTMEINALKTMLHKALVNRPIYQLRELDEEPLFN